MNKKGNLFLGLFMTIFAVMIFIAVVPILNSMLNIAQQSDNLNCQGYVHNANSSNPLSYNSSLSTDSISCILIDLYIPYIALGLLFYAGTRFISGRPQSPQDYFGGGTY